MTNAREAVFQAISTEREHQEQKWPRGTGCARSIGEEILCMEECLLAARGAWQRGDDFTPSDAEVMLSHVRKVAAVAVRCMENHGAPAR